MACAADALDDEEVDAEGRRDLAHLDQDHQQHIDERNQIDLRIFAALAFAIGCALRLARFNARLDMADEPRKAAGFLTRDSRVVERKKYGKAKARKSFQFSKR